LSEIYKEKIPNGNQAYLFESKKYVGRDTKIIPYLLKLQRYDLLMQAIIKNSIVLSSKQNECQMFILNSRKLAKKFEILIGNERVKSSELVFKFLHPIDKENEIHKLKSLALNYELQFTDFFKRAPNELKEPLALNYVRAACFYNSYSNVTK
jgi:hypothetical protein